MSRNYSEQDEHKIKSHDLRALPKHTAVVIHCERGHRRKLLPPLEPNGQISEWFGR
jgi:rhodanese-related sulfurtransferase